LGGLQATIKKEDKQMLKWVTGSRDTLINLDNASAIGIESSGEKKHCIMVYFPGEEDGWCWVEEVSLKAARLQMEDIEGQLILH
jgi:hypothetical protein